MIIDRGWIHPDDRYINVSLDLIAAIGHVPALVIARVAFRTSGRWPGVIEVDGLTWWRASLTDIAEDLSMSKRQMQRILAALVEEGTLIREKHQLDSDRAVLDHTYSYRINFGELPDTDVDPAGAPEEDNMSTSTEEDNMSTSGEGLPFGTERVTEREHRPPIKEVKKSNNASAREDHHIFEMFWDLYPKQIAKGAARTEWRTAVRKETASTILAGAQRLVDYLEKYPDQTPYQPPPAKWLHDECWTDVLVPPASAMKKPTAPVRARLPLYVPED